MLWKFYWSSSTATIISSSSLYDFILCPKGPRVSYTCRDVVCVRKFSPTILKLFMTENAFSKNMGIGQMVSAIEKVDATLLLVIMCWSLL